MMKIFAFLLIIFIILAGIIYVIPSYRAKAVQLLTYNACDTPLPYRIGVIDARFGLTREDVSEDIQQATTMWSTAEGKNLFVSSPDAIVTVNFMYDQRQALNSSINELNSDLSQKDQALKQQIDQYEADVASFKERLAALNSTIDHYNEEGGAPPDIYQDLIKQQDELKSEAKTLNERAHQLNLSTNDYNYNVSVLNSDINQFNSELAQKPEEGLYNGANKTITIYLTSGKDELIHTLAHEFGHALGMGHVEDPQAIMYPYTTSSLTVTNADKKELDDVCRNQSRIVHELQSFDIWIITNVHNIESHVTK